MSGTNSISGKKIIIFDLDGTLTRSKSDLDQEMASLICELLRVRYVAVTSGCSFQQFESQFLSGLPASANLCNLLLFPTCSASGYYYDRKRRRFFQAYTNHLSARDVKKILRSFTRVFAGNRIFPSGKDIRPSFREQGRSSYFFSSGSEGSASIEAEMGPKSAEEVEDKEAPEDAFA